MSDYQVGGSLNLNAATYVTRQANAQLYKAVLRGEFCYTFNCRQMVKSSLRVRTKNRLEHQGPALPGSEIDWVKNLVKDKIIDNWESQDEPEHIRTIRDRLLSDEQQASLLLNLSEHIFRYGFIAADDSLEQKDLLLSNLVVKRSGQLIFRNLIYQRIFNLNWIELLKPGVLMVLYCKQLLILVKEFGGLLLVLMVKLLPVQVKDTVSSYGDRKTPYWLS